MRRAPLDRAIACGVVFGALLGALLGVAPGAGPRAAGAQAAPGPDACDPARQRALGGLELRLRSAPALASAGPEATAAARGTSRGYLGLRLSEVSATTWTPEGRVVRYCGYPVVVSVEPASPAERAGLDAGDTLVAYGAHDLVRAGPVPLDQLLVPGRVLRVQLRRGGRTLTRPVVVGRAPSLQIVAVGGPSRASFGSSDGPVAPFRVEVAWPAAGAEGGSAADPGDASADPAAEARRRHVQAQLRSQLLLRAPAAPARTLVGRAVTAQAPRASAPSAAARASADAWAVGGAGAPEWLDVLRALPTLPATAWAAGAPAALAGAQLVALDDDLREVLARTTGGAAGGQDEGPVRGVFVLKVLPGTPAAEAGLRAGDVVTTAGGRMVATPAALQRVLAVRTLTRAESPTAPGGAERRTVPLRVWRAGVARDAVLRW